MLHPPGGPHPASIANRDHQADNVFELMLRRGPGRERLENWSQAAACLLRRYMGEQARVRHGALDEAAGALARNPEVRRLLRTEPDEPPPPTSMPKRTSDKAAAALYPVVAKLDPVLPTGPTGRPWWHLLLSILEVALSIDRSLFLDATPGEIWRQLPPAGPVALGSL